jgi:hypothetical protein
VFFPNAPRQRSKLERSERAGELFLRLVSESPVGYDGAGGKVRTTFQGGSVASLALSPIRASCVFSDLASSRYEHLATPAGSAQPHLGNRTRSLIPDRFVGSGIMSEGQAVASISSVLAPRCRRA